MNWWWADELMSRWADVDADAGQISRWADADADAYADADADDA